MCRTLSMTEANERCKYLGLPNFLGRNKAAILGFLKEKVQNRIRSRKDKSFSKPGKEVLIKSVVQSLSTFAMSVFLLPQEISKDIERSLAKFWWDDPKTGKKIHWLSWERLCKHKSVGGMGFRNFRDFNVAMLGKQAWRMITVPNTLATKLYRARYFPDGSFFDAKLGHNPSFIWRSIWESRDLIMKGIRWRVGPGESISIKGQPWLSDELNLYVETENQGLENQKVSSLLCMDRREWYVELLRDMFTVRDQNFVLNTKLEAESRRDVVYWEKESTWMYYVKSAYKLIQSMKGHWHTSNIDEIWSKFWRIRAPPKALNMVWRALNNCLPTLMQLREKHVQVTQICPVCFVGEETIFHSLVFCSFASSCWRILLADNYGVLESNFAEWLNNVMSRCGQVGKAEVIVVCWSIWKARNEIVWNKKATSVNRVVALAKQHLIQWKAAQAVSTSALLQPGYVGDGVDVWVKPQRDTIKVTVDATIFRRLQWGWWLEIVLEN